MSERMGDYPDYPGRPVKTGRLTPHQRAVYARLGLLSREGMRWVPERNLGSHGALWRLIHKGYAEAREVIGPRGGIHYEYRSK